MNFKCVTKSYGITFGAAEPNSISAKRNADMALLLELLSPIPSVQREMRTQKRNFR